MIACILTLYEWFELENTTIIWMDLLSIYCTYTQKWIDVRNYIVKTSLLLRFFMILLSTTIFFILCGRRTCKILLTNIYILMFIQCSIYDCMYSECYWQTESFRFLFEMRVLWWYIYLPYDDGQRSHYYYIMYIVIKYGCLVWWSLLLFVSWMGLTKIFIKLLPWNIQEKEKRETGFRSGFLNIMISIRALVRLLKTFVRV